MAIELVRIDDRLIHGQVATAWCNDYKIEQILVINEGVKGDPVQQSILSMTAPSGIIVKVFGVSELVNILKTNEIKKRTMLILTCPKDVCELIAGGIDITSVNIGGMRFGSNRRMLSKAVFTTEEDERYLKALCDSGVDVEVRLIPKSDGVKMNELLKQVKQEEER